MRVAPRFAVGLVVVVATALIAVAVVGRSASGAKASSVRASRAQIAPAPETGHLPAPRTGTFISLWPACACAKRTVLDQFSLKTGRRLGTVLSVPVATGESVSRPAARAGGPVLLTFSSGPRCAGPPGGGASAGACVPLPNSCTGRVESLNPATGAVGPLVTTPSSTLVTDTVPSPDGRMVVMTTAGCETSYFDASLVVRNLASGQQWSIGADAARCHDLGRPAWSGDGSRLVFPYGPSILPRRTKPLAQQMCSAPRSNRLAVVPSGRASSTTAWKLIRADKGCSFESATFDRRGIAAAEGCRRGDPRGVSADPGLGDAYLLQLNRDDRVVARAALEPGWEEGLVSTVPRSRMVLVSQDQPANQSYRERDWVWEFDGYHLHAVGHYSAHDAAQVIAAAW